PNSGRAVTHPVGSAAPSRSANAPRTAVVATDPRAPSSHTPVRPILWSLLVRSRGPRPGTRPCSVVVAAVLRGTVAVLGGIGFQGAAPGRRGQIQVDVAVSGVEAEHVQLGRRHRPGPDRLGAQVAGEFGHLGPQALVL